MEKSDSKCINSKQQFQNFCDPCKLEFSDILSWQRHVSGKYHKKLTQSQAHSKDGNIPVKSSKPKKAKAKAKKKKTQQRGLPDFCDVCKVEIHDDFSWQRHVSGKKHKKRVSQQASSRAGSDPVGPPAPPNEGQHFQQGSCVGSEGNHIQKKTLVSADVLSGNASGERDLNESGKIPISLATRNLRCRICDTESNDEAGLKAHKNSRTHQRALRSARKGARSMIKYLAFALSSDWRPPFEHEVSDDELEEQKCDLSFLQGDQEMMDIILEIRKANAKSTIDHRWNRFLAAVAHGHEAMLFYEEECNAMDVWGEAAADSVDADYILGSLEECGDIPDAHDL